jgi:hypothetical protein
MNARPRNEHVMINAESRNDRVMGNADVLSLGTSF